RRSRARPITTADIAMNRRPERNAPASFNSATTSRDETRGTMRLPARLAACLLASSALAACATTDGTDRSATASGTAAETGSPYASTYRPYPGRPTALVGATVFDGRGGQIDNGTVLFRDGKVVAVGGSSLSTDGYDRVD